MPEEYILKLSEKELLALRELVGQVDDHSPWMKDVFTHGDQLELVYKKVYDLSGPVIRKLNEMNNS